MTSAAKQQTSPEDVAHQVALGLVGLGEAAAPVMAAVEGYRLQYEQSGYSDALSRKMAADYHGFLMKALVQ